MKRVEVRGYTREGGREFVNSYSRNDPRMVAAAFAAMKAVRERMPEKAVQMRSLSSEKLSAAPSHLTAEIMAVAAYEPSNAILPSGYQPAETITDSRTGLAVTVFVSPNKKPVVAFRGTEGGKLDARDVMTDVDPRGIGYAQFEGNKQKLAAIAQKYPGATVTGHSLGGALAQRYAAEFNNAGEVITFNSPGIDKVTAAKFKGGKKATHYISDGDPVSLGGESFINGTAKVISYKSGKSPVIGNTLDKHLSIVNAGLLGNSEASVKTITAAELSNPNFRYGSARATGGVSRGFVEGSRKGVGAIASPLQPVVAIAGAALGKFGIGVN